LKEDVSITFKRLLNGKNIATVPANGNRKKQPDRFIHFRDHCPGVVPALEDHLYIKDGIPAFFAAPLINYPVETAMEFYFPELPTIAFP
jgi:hypothetical protein